MIQNVYKKVTCHDDTFSVRFDRFLPCLYIQFGALCVFLSPFSTKTHNNLVSRIPKYINLKSTKQADPKIPKPYGAYIAYRPPSLQWESWIKFKGLAIQDVLQIPFGHSCPGFIYPLIIIIGAQTYETLLLHTHTHTVPLVCVTGPSQIYDPMAGLEALAAVGDGGGRRQWQGLAAAPPPSAGAGLPPRWQRPGGGERIDELGGGGGGLTVGSVLGPTVVGAGGEVTPRTVAQVLTGPLSVSKRKMSQLTGTCFWPPVLSVPFAKLNFNRQLQLNSTQLSTVSNNCLCTL